MTGKFPGLAACVCLWLLAAWSGTEARDLSSMSGEEVKLLQQRLTDAECYTGAVDGTASEAVEAAKNACPDQEPILRIETGMHVAPIRSIAVDAQCRIAATGSDDKTVRLWSMPDGRLIRTPRLPIGDGLGGRVNAVAVSPDGRLVAAGGRDAHYAADQKHSVYLFDSGSGVSLRRLGGFDSYITQLTFSPDASRLAVGLGGGGIRVIDVATGDELMADRDYSAKSFGVAFGSDGALYATGLDGFLRRYDATFKRTAKVKTPGGKLPFSVAVDPGGRRVAVGYDDAFKVDLFDARDLRALGSTDTTDIVNGALPSVAWSLDGRRIFGGSYGVNFNGKPRGVILSWTADGRKAGAGVPVSNTTVMNLVPCSADIAFAVGDPAFGILKPDDVVVALGATLSADMNNKLGEAFMVSPDSTRVRFGLGQGSDKSVLFDFSTATIVDAPIAPTDLAAPRIDGLEIKDWKNSIKPTFVGRAIALLPYEGARSLATRADNSGFALGSDLFLRAFDAAGKQRWEELAPGAAMGVSLAKNDAVILAAYGDGTIRWHRWSDGQELLALFVEAKDRRWVAWTPTGYYMASAGGEDLIGWQVNRGWEQQADFFPASRFRDRFNRPDIVRLVLETLDEGEAVKRANETAKRRQDTAPLMAKLPPVIRIDDPAMGAHVSSAEVTLSYSWRSPSGLPLDRIDVLVDGRSVKEVDLPFNAKAAGMENAGSLSVSVPPRDAEVGLIAWSGDLASEAVRVKLIWSGAVAADSHNRKLYALAIGVSDYVAPDMALDYAAKDARDFAHALEGQKGGYYSDVEARVITDHDVTRSSIIAGLEWLQSRATGTDDVSVLFLAGHGLTDEKQSYWFLPSDATEDDVRARGVSQDEVRRSLQSLPGKVLWFLDTCHAGSAARRAPVDVNLLLNTVTSAENGGIVVFASSTGREVSVESSAWQNGAFTKAIVEGIQQGKADLGKEGTITTSELDFFLAKRARELTDGRQHPVMGRPPQEPDFTIAQVRKY